jgi:homoserine O-acetyltransferase
MDSTQRHDEAVSGPEAPAGQTALLGVETPLTLDCGVELGPFTVAYETYGKLNEDRSNVILACHALTGDQFVTGTNPISGKPGWWPLMIGPGQPFDTDRYFVVCANVLGGCMGTTGPKSIDPKTEKPYGLSFPVITIKDMVRAQAMLLDYLGIQKIFCVSGGSMGGMQALQWTVTYSDRVHSAIPMGSAAHHTAQNIALHEVGRQAIMGDPDWHGGDYLSHNTIPRAGLSVARMAAHISYLSEAAMHRKFGRQLQDRDTISYGFGADFQVESYLRHQGTIFVERFDANSYLYLTRAMDYFDLISEFQGVLGDAFKHSPTRFCIISFTGDWLFPTSENRTIVHALNAAAANVSFVEVESDKGHDAFLLDEPEMFETIRGFLKGAAEHWSGDTP